MSSKVEPTQIFHVTAESILLNAINASLASGVGIYRGTGAPSGDLSGGVATPTQVYLREGAASTTAMLYLSRDTGSTWTAVAGVSGSQLTDGVVTVTANLGSISEAGLVNLDLSGSGTLNLTGGGVSTFGDDTAVWTFNGTGGVALTSATSINLGTSALTLGQAAVTVSNDVQVTVKDNSATSVAIGSTGLLGLIALDTTNAAEKVTIGGNFAVATGKTASTNTLTETTAGNGIALGSGVEILGVPKVVSAAVAYNTADGVLFSVPAGEVWVIDAMWFRTTTSWDGNGAAIIGDATDTDGYLVLANASLKTTYDETGGVAGWTTGTRGLKDSNRGAYLAGAAPDAQLSPLRVGPYDVLLDNTPGTSTTGVGVAYMKYTRIS